MNADINVSNYVSLHGGDWTREVLMLSLAAKGARKLRGGRTP
jgi:hypothetical protein